MKRSGTKPKPCINTLNLDKRRKAVGLMPIKKYLQQCDETFEELNPTEMKKKIELKRPTKYVETMIKYVFCFLIVLAPFSFLPPLLVKAYYLRSVSIPTLIKINSVKNKNKSKIFGITNC